MDRYGDREVKPSQKIYISNLSIDTNQNDLRKSFDPHGTIVDINLKQKDTGIVFAFIEFDSVESAQRAVDAMNKKTLNDKELKVQFARGRGDRDNRGGYQRDYNDRGGYRGGRDFDRDRRPREDRPRGCFNCGEEGHFAKQCSKPRQPRDFNRDRNNDRGGYRGGNRDYRGENERRGGDDRRDRDRDRNYRKKQESGSRSRSRSGDKKRRQKNRRSSSSSSNSR